MFFSKKKKSRIVTALTLCAVTAVSVMSIGLASWQTTITGSGSVNAAGKWDVAVTDANLNLSSAGAQARLDYSDYHLQANSLTATQLGNLCISAAVPRNLYTSGTRGVQSKTVGLDKNQNCNLCLVDATRIDISRFGHIPTNGDDGRAALYRNYADGTDSNAPIIRLSDTNVAPDGTKISPLKAWMYYKSKTDYFGDTAVQGKIAADLVEKADELIRVLRPDAYQNYVLVNFTTNQVTDSTKDQSDVQFIIATMGAADGKEPSAVSYTDTEVSFADVDFTLPGAWAKYSITVTNNGTVDANLSDAVIELETDSDQLVLDKPDLEKEVVKPGESCTITFEVKVPDTVTGDLDASGRLIITLPYGQISVEAAPAASHSHS